MLLTDLIQFIKTNRNNSNRASFQLNDEGLDMCIKWAFNRDYLLLVSDENGISGFAIVYPLPKPCDWYIKSLIPYDDELAKDAELNNELCVLDWIALNSKARKELINKFMTKFPNWENQNKWGIQRGTIKNLTNKYMNKLKGIN